MQIGENVKKAREAKGLSQKEVAATLKMDQNQCSKIENGKVDPQFSTIEKIAKAIRVNVIDLVADGELFKEVATYDKTLVEKVQLIDGLEEQEKIPLLEHRWPGSKTKIKTIPYHRPWHRPIKSSWLLSNGFKVNIYTMVRTIITPTDTHISFPYRKIM